MKKYISIFVFCMLLSVYGQTAVKKSSLSTAGGSQTAGNTTVIYAVGEVAVQEQTQGNILVSEGFVGPDFSALGIENYSDLTGIEVYPNPVKDIFTVNLPANRSYEFYLYDMNGKQIWAKTGDKKKQQFNIDDFQSAVYLLVIVDRNLQKKKIVKLQKK